jgi:hypothetical protein
MALRARRVAPAFVILALTMQAGASGAQVIATAGAPTGPRTGMIVGQVVDSTGAPVPEAIVQMSMPRYFTELPTTPKGRVMADGEGRFFFADLPAGDYYIRAAKEGYGGGVYGQRRPSAELELLPLGENERRMDTKLTLWKHAVIGGTVVDEVGEPVVGVAVRALARDVVAGRVSYGTEIYRVPTALTDDRGMFRLSQLTPGTYVVVVPSPQATVPLAVMTQLDAATLRNELFRAGVSEVSPLGQPRTQQIGDVALLTLNSVLIPPPVSPAGRIDAYRTTYYPTAATASAGTPIALGAGDERTDLTITMRPGPAVRIAGRLATPDGSTPPLMGLRLVGAARVDVISYARPSGPGDVGFETVAGLSDAGGRFALIGVPPGEYILEHSSSSLAARAQQGQAAYWVSQRIAVGSSDITGLTVQLRPALRVEGRIEYRGANGPQSTPANVLSAVIFETPFGDSGQFAVEISRDGQQSFATVAAGGRYIVRPVESSGWFVKSVALGGKDITDRVFDLQADATSLVVVYTDQPSKLIGTVKDARGASVSATVLAFPVDPQRWTGYGSNPRDVKSAPASRAGVYTFSHLPPGDYYVIAIDDAELDGWTDPKRLDALARQATKLKVVEGGMNTLDLTLRTIR